MSDSKFAYSTTDPEALAAYRAALVVRREFGARLRRAAAALGDNLGPLVSVKEFGGPEEITGLEPAATGKKPAGWRLVPSRKRLEPAIGKAGDQARRWLVEHQPPADADPRYVLKAHGLAYYSRVPSARGTQLTLRPHLFEFDDRLWACYRGHPDGDWPGDDPGLTWPQVSLDEFVQAYAKFQLAEAKPASAASA